MIIAILKLGFLMYPSLMGFLCKKKLLLSTCTNKQTKQYFGEILLQLTITFSILIYFENLNIWW